MFESFAKEVGKKIKRINSIQVNGPVIMCNVDSNTGFSDWNFKVDFNNWGHITGTFWIKTENYDSSIPGYYGRKLSGLIQEYYKERGITLRDLSDYVDRNHDLLKDGLLEYSYKPNLFDRIFRKNNKNVVITYGTEDLIGEHLYPVISMLLDSGFRNIKSVSISDINNKSENYIFQVEKVIIDGCDRFDSGMQYKESSKVCIYYHDKQTIKMLFSEKDAKNKNHITVGRELQKLGFTELYESEIEDLIIGLLVKEGAVERVLLDGDEGKPIIKGAHYTYDQEIVIVYHTKRESMKDLFGKIR